MYCPGSFFAIAALATCLAAAEGLFFFMSGDPKLSLSRSKKQLTYVFVRTLQPQAVDAVV
jgi:hypothetical protein